MTEILVTLVDGRHEPRISVQDRGLHYGDGVFRTMLADHGQVWGLQHQLRKLGQDAGRLDITMPDDKTWAADIAVALSGRQSAVLKLILTRGSGPRGYQAHAAQPVSRIVISYAPPASASDFSQTGISLYECRTRLGHNPSLAGIKHLNRLEQVLARNEFSGDAHQEGLMLDINGHVVCGTMSNLFIVAAGKLITPSLAQCGVSGVTRSNVLELAEEMGIETAIREVTMEECRQADEMFICNSVIGIWPVRRLGDCNWQQGPIALQLQAHLGHPRN